MADIQSLRKKNLRALIAQWHGPTVLAKKLKYSGPSYLSQLIGPSKPITEKTARHIEEEVGLPPGWLDSENAERRTAGGKVDSGILSSVALQVMAEAAEAGLQLSPKRMAEVLAFVWEQTVERGKTDDAFVKNLIKLLQEE